MMIKGSLYISFYFTIQIYISVEWVKEKKKFLGDILYFLMNSWFYLCLIVVVFFAKIFSCDQRKWGLFDSYFRPI